MTNPAPTPTVAEVQQKIDNTINKPLPKAPDFEKEVLGPLREEQERDAIEAARVAEEARLLAEQQAAVQAIRLQPSQPIVAAREVQQPQYASGSLTGSIGFAIPYGNCVNQIPLSIRPNGNPSTWPATSSSPYIGATALFNYNHTGKVTGIWSNGDLEIGHENYKGNQTRFPRGAFRGFR